MNPSFTQMQPTVRERRQKSPSEITAKYVNKSYESDSQDLYTEDAYIPQSKMESQKEYAYWKMKYEEDLQSCLKKFKQCSLKDDIGVRAVKASKDSAESLLKRKKGSMKAC